LRFKYLILVFTFLAFGFTSLNFALAQTKEGKMVVAVRVKGNKAISAPTVISKIKTKEGASYSQEVINDDIKRLYVLGYFTDVTIDAEEYKEGVMVTVIVEEKPVVKEIVFEGNKSMRSARIKKVMQVKEGDMLNFSKLSEDVSEIRLLYEKNGFHQVSVQYEIEKDQVHNQAIIKVKIKEKVRIRIKKVNAEGNASIKTKKILELMQTKPAWLFRRGYFDEQLFEDDLTRIKIYYRDFGFLDISITPELKYDEEKGIMYITLKIDEGNKYHIDRVLIRGNIVAPEEEIRSLVTLKTGDAFSYTKLRETLEGVRSFYYQRGYMNADIKIDRALSAKKYSIDIILDIDAREIVYIGKIDVKGNSKTKDMVVRRELRVFPGDRFDGDKIRRSKERLYNLGFFEDIYFETKPTTNPNISDLEIHVKESKTGEFAFGAGYSSVDQFIGFVQITQKNFDILNWPYFTGDGQNLILKAQGGVTRLDFTLSWTEPWILDYPILFGFDAYHRTHFRTTQVGYGYQERRSGGNVRLGKEFLEYFNANFMYRLENVDISDVSSEATSDLKDEEGQNWLSSMILGVGFDNRDNLFSPTRGIVVGASLENTGGFLMGNKDFVKGYLWASLYVMPINKIIVEFRGRAGLASSYGNTDSVPIYERFYAGGANSIRGYRERKVGPRDPRSNDPIGGESTAIGNVEITFPIYEKLVKGAVFYDVGNAWDKWEKFGKGGFKQGAGIGVRVKTPIGPISVDWGYPLSENHDDKKEGQFYFSASHGF